MQPHSPTYEVRRVMQDCGIKRNFLGRGVSGLKSGLLGFQAFPMRAALLRSEGKLQVFKGVLQL